MVNTEEYLWLTEHLEYSNDPSDWRQSLSTLAFITTESYGKGVLEEILIPWLQKAIQHSNPKIQKIGIRFMISLRTFDLMTPVDESILAETFYEKFLKKKKPDFLSPLKTCFTKLRKEGKLALFLDQLGEGKFTPSVAKEISSQLWYRQENKMEHALEMIQFLIENLDVDKEEFVPILKDFTQDLEDRLYLKGKKEIKQKLISHARLIIGENSQETG